MSDSSPVGLANLDAPVRVLTHSGNFHADDAMGYAILHYALAPGGNFKGRITGNAPDDRMLFERSRSPERIWKADIVFDVGGVYDPVKGRYDHHMRDKPLRADVHGTPYSAAGLLWKDYGRAAVRNILTQAVTDGQIELIWQSIDQSFVLPVDQDDNGVMKMGRLSLADIVSACSPPWDTAEMYGEDEARKREALGFANAAAAVAAHLVNTIDRLRAGLKAVDRVVEAYESAEDKRILLMETGMPTEKVIFERELPVVYVVSPSGTGHWNVKAIPPKRGEFGQRVSLPDAWAGLERSELARVSGIPDAVFAHPARFICGAETRESALKMARMALDIAEAEKTGG